MDCTMEIPAEFNAGQYKVIFELMVEPLILTVSETCNGRREVAEELIIMANRKQISGDELLRVFGRSHDVLMDALNGLTKLYNREDLLDSTFGKNTLSLHTRRYMINHMIAVILDQQYAGVPSRNAMQELRNLVLAWSRAKRSASGESQGLYDALIAAAKRRHKIPNASRDGYSSINPDISHLDLSGMDFSNLNDLKQMQWVNCNLSHCNFTNTQLARANFSNSNLTQANFTGCNMIGEEVSFANADCQGAIFINVQMERGLSWARMNTGDDLKAEIIARGGLNVDKAVFGTVSTGVSASAVGQVPSEHFSRSIIGALPLARNQAIVQPQGLELDRPNLAAQLEQANTYIGELEARVAQLEARNSNGFFAPPSPRASSLPLARDNHETQCNIL